MDVKSQTVKRLYKAGSWTQLANIVCNMCLNEKCKDCFPANRYTCKDCLAERPHKTTKCAREQPSIKRQYKNGSWSSLENITCSHCEINQPKEAYKLNRYVCMMCSKKQQKSHNEKKKSGKYTELQKQYYANYEASSHGRQRRIAYRNNMLKNERNSKRSSNVMSMLKNKILGVLCDNNVTVKTAVQYLGVSQPIFKKWIEHNFDSRMTWENIGITWKVDIYIVPSLECLATEKQRYDAFNWRNWLPVSLLDGQNGNIQNIRHLQERNIFFSTTV